MFIYLFVFFISLLFTLFCEKTKLKPCRILFAIIAILAPALLAGFRNYGVGTDTGSFYFKVTYNEVFEYKDCGLWSFLKATIGGEFTQEPFYCILNYIGLQLGAGENYVYFVVSLFTITFVFNAIYLYKEKASMTFMMFLFLFLYYNMSLNIIRQSLAIALSLNVYLYLEKKQWIKSLLFLGLLFLSHTTAIVFLLFLLLYVAKKIKVKRYLIIALIAVVPISMIMLNELILIAIDFGIVPERFVAYMVGEADTDLSISKSMVAYGWFAFGAIFVYGYPLLKDRNISKEIVFVFDVKLLSNFLILAGAVSIWAFRMAYYFSVFDILFLPRVVRAVSCKNRLKGRILAILISGITIFYWYWSIIHNNENETYPYKSKILGI